MAVTKGHGNPNWTFDEVVLALDLYFECDGKVPGPRDERVQDLSKLLRTFPYHAAAARKESFRNPDGVAFKLQNLRQVATGHGLGNVSTVDRAVWEQLGHDRQHVKELADLIRDGLYFAEELAEATVDDDLMFAEGRVATETHVRRERNSKVRKLLLRKRRAAGRLKCDICGAEPQLHDEALHDAMFEAHHLLPLAAGKERTTRLNDMALICANCHRLTHRAIAIAKRWLTLEEVKNKLQ